MKYILIAAVALLALAQGSFAQDGTELERLTQYFETMKVQFNEMINNPEVASRAQSFLTEKSAQMQPLLAQIQEHIESATANAQEQIKPMAKSVHAQVQPAIEEFQNHLQSLINAAMEQARALGN